MSVSPLERSVLERKERDELAAIAEAMGVKANSRTSKANLIEGILREAGVETGEDKPKRARTAKADANGEEEAEKTEDDTRLDVQFKKGDKIKVTNGAFQNFEGEVEEIIPDKGMVRIITTIFGRPTPLELEYWQIEKM